MFSPSRNQARQFFFDTWRKFADKQPLTALESIALDVILRHPEYHALLDKPDSCLDRDYPPEFGETNPFLHLGLHLAIEEQLAIDQPPGIKARYQQLLTSLEAAHDAQHAVMECLAETIWQAQRQNTSPDSAAYLDCLASRLAQAPGFHG